MQYTFTHLLWNTSGSSDKIWGVIDLPSSQTFYNFWGRRGAKLTFKRYDRYQKLGTLAKNKQLSGYRAVTAAELVEHDPEFLIDFERQFVVATMFDNFHGS